MDITTDETFVCNICLCQLHVSRFKCTCCVDFDVCEECLDAANELHRSHIFLKISVNNIEEHQLRSENKTPSVAEQLAVLDGVQYFRLDQGAISKQLRIPCDVVQWTIGSMFQQLAADQSSNFEEECPDLVDDMLGSVALLSERNEQSRMNVDGIADFGGTNAMLLWDSLEAVAHDDDIAGVAQLDALQRWITQRSDTNIFNLRALLRVNNLAAKLTREPILQKKILKFTEATVPGNSRITATKRKNLQQALKKQSRSRTKAAVEDIVTYAVATHFTQALALKASRSSTRSSKGHGSKKQHHKRKHRRTEQSRHSGKRRVVQVSPASVVTGVLPAEEKTVEEESSGDSEGESSSSDISNADTDTSESADESDEQQEKEKQERLASERDVRLPANMRATRTKRKEAPRDTFQQLHQVTPGSAAIVARTRTYFTDTDTDPDGLDDAASTNLFETFNEAAQAHDDLLNMDIAPAAVQEDGDEEEQGWLSPHELAEVHRRSTSADVNLSVVQGATPTIASPSALASLSEHEAPREVRVGGASHLQQQQQPPRRRGRPRKVLLPPPAAQSSTPTSTSLSTSTPTSITTRTTALSVRRTSLVKRNLKPVALNDRDRSDDEDSGSSSSESNGSTRGDSAAAALLAECEVLLPSHMRATRTMRKVAVQEVSQWKAIGVLLPAPSNTAQTMHQMATITPQKRKRSKAKNNAAPSTIGSSSSSSTLLLPPLSTSDMVETSTSATRTAFVAAADFTSISVLPLLPTEPPPLPPSTLLVLPSPRCHTFCLPTFVLDPAILLSCWNHRQYYTPYSCSELYVPNYSALHVSLMEYSRCTYVIHRSLSIGDNAGASVGSGNSTYTQQPVDSIDEVTTLGTPAGIIATNSIKPTPVAQRSILKKRTLDEFTATTSSTTAIESESTVAPRKHAKKGVRFDITASMQYKRWRSGRASNFSVEEALLEVQGRDDSPSNTTNSSPSADTRDTESAASSTASSVFPLLGTPTLPLLTWQPPPSSLPATQSQPLSLHTIPLSILKKRSFSETTDSTTSSNLNSTYDTTDPYVTPEQSPRKSVRFSEEVPVESKARTGVYMSYKRRLAERTARLSALLQTTPLSPNKRTTFGTSYSFAASTGGKLSSHNATVLNATSTSSSDTDSSSALELTSTNLGSFWSSFRTPVYPKYYGPSSAAVSNSNYTIATNTTTKNNPDTNSIGHERSITWSARHNESHHERAEGSDTESDITEASQSPPPAWSIRPAGEDNTTVAGSSNPGGDSSANSSTGDSYSNSNSSSSNSRTASCSVRPCSLHDEFLDQEYEFNPFTTMDTNHSSNDKCVDTSNENIDTSNIATTTATSTTNSIHSMTDPAANTTCNEEENSPFFEDDPYYTPYSTYASSSKRTASVLRCP